MIMEIHIVFYIERMLVFINNTKVCVGHSCVLLGIPRIAAEMGDDVNIMQIYLTFQGYSV